VGGPAEWASPKQPHGTVPDLEKRPPRGCFPRSARLRSRSDFSRAKTSSERVITRHFVFLLSPQCPVLSEPRLGVTASRKVGTAVVRNRAKRLVREAFRATRDTLWTPGVDIIVVVRNIAPDTRLQEVVAEWLGARSKVIARSKEFSQTHGNDARIACLDDSTNRVKRRAHSPS
jgi:ribonuclease P protein component